MSRKGENIHKRKDGRWEARYIKSRDKNGKIQYGYVYASRYSDVKEKRNQILYSLGNKTSLTQELSESMCFNELFDIWKLKTLATVKKSSYCFYETIIQHHLCPYWGEILVSQISEQLIQKFILLKIEAGLSISYINTIATIFKSILNYARQKGYLAVPIPDFQIPKYKKRNAPVFNLVEWTRLNDYLLIQDDRFSFGIFLCMYTGIRIGELCGLRGDDYDDANGQLMIRRTVYRIKNAAYTPDNHLPKTVVTIDAPKTPSSIRDIPLPSFLCEKIQQYSNNSGNSSNYILTGSTEYMEPRIVQKKYKEILEKCGIRYLNFHSLRHSFASIGISKGFDCKTLSEILGHSSVNITLNTYVHSSIEQKRQCMELMMRK